MVSRIKNLIMKILTSCVLAASFMLAAIPSQTKAATNTETAKSTSISTERIDKTDQLRELTPIDSPALNSPESKETLKVTSPLADEQGRHNSRYNNRPPKRDVDVTIQSDRGNRHSHSGIYIGGGSILILVLILIIVL
jgi:hypothetical protein